MKKNINPIKLVIFDMDGTIFDTERLGVESWIEAFEKMEIPVPKKVLLNKIGLNSKDSKKLMKEESGVDFDYDQVKALKRKIIKEKINKNGTPVKEGFIELVNFLKENKIKIALATSRSQEMTHYYLEKAGENFSDFFDFIVTGDMIERGKPEPDIFLHACNKLETPAQNSLVIEDSFNGIKAAHAGQIPVIMVPDLVEPSPEIEKMVCSVKKHLGEVVGFLKSEDYVSSHETCLNKPLYKGNERD